jgi:hypothetical protein
MYGDTTVIRGLASRLREQATDIAREADALVGLADDCPWHGWAADAVRRRSRERAAALRRTAHAHDGAADALDHHADRVDRLKDLIASIERKALRLVDAARDRLGDLVDGVRGLLSDGLDGADALLDRFVPPPPGHRDWLDVELPGLHR